MATLNEVMQRPELASFTTAQQCLDYFNATTPVKPTDEPYSYSGVGVLFATKNIDMSIQLAIRTFILSLPVGGESLDVYLSSPGKLDFTLAGVQGQLAANLAATTDPLKQAAIQAMIDVGQMVDTPNWKTLGLDAEPELADIQSWLSYQRVVRYARQISNIAASLHNLNDGKMFPDWATLKAKAIELIDNAGVEVGG